MIGVIAGDVIGSVHEHGLMKSSDFPLFDPLSRFRWTQTFNYRECPTVSSRFAVQHALHQTAAGAIMSAAGERWPLAGHQIVDMPGGVRTSPHPEGRPCR